MAATNKVSILALLEGLGELEQFTDSFSTNTTITAKQHGYQTQAVADTAEALDLGGVTTPHLIIMKCVTNDCDLDCNYSSSFSEDITVKEGEIAVFCPSGTVYLKNEDASEQSTVEYVVWGV